MLVEYYDSQGRLEKRLVDSFETGIYTPSDLDDKPPANKTDARLLMPGNERTNEKITTY